MYWPSENGKSDGTSLSSDFLIYAALVVADVLVSQPFSKIVMFSLHFETVL